MLAVLRKVITLNRLIRDFSLKSSRAAAHKTTISTPIIKLCEREIRGKSVMIIAAPTENKAVFRVFLWESSTSAVRHKHKKARMPLVKK